MNQSDSWLSEGRKSIVYATSTDFPVYPSKLYCGDIVPVPGSVIGLQGSGVVISGGFLRDTPETAEIMECGVITMLHPEGARFVERALALSSQGANRVLLLYPQSRQADEHLVPVLRQRGFDVLTTGGKRRYSQADTVAIGPAFELKGLEWLEDVIWYTTTLLVAFGSDRPKLVQMLVDCASSDHEVYPLLAGLQEDIARAPEFLGELLQGYEVFAAFGGPEGNNVAVMLRNLDINSLHRAYRQIAADLEMPLYYAGDIDAPDLSGHHFLDFHAFDEWRTVSGHWTQENRNERDV